MEQAVAAEQKQCTAIRRKGGRCPRPAIPTLDVCPLHRPEFMAALRDAGTRGGKRNGERQAELRRAKQEQEARERGVLLDAGLDLGTTRGQRQALEHAFALVARGEPDASERAKAIAVIVKAATEVADRDRDAELEQLREQVARVVAHRSRRPVLDGSIAASSAAIAPTSPASCTPDVPEDGAPGGDR